MSLGLSTGIFLDTPTLGSLLGGISLTPSTLTRTSAVSAYPPTVSFTRPLDWQDGDKGVMQWSLDPTFATGVTEGSVVTFLTATTTYNFGLSAIVSGVYYMRLLAWRGSRPTVPNSISNIVGVGDAVAPTITSSAAPAGFQFLAGSQSLTANKLSTWAIVGGADQAQFTLSGSTLSWATQSATGNYVVQVQATSVFGIVSAVQTVTLAVATNTANAFSFTPVTNATRSTLYTSNTVTITIPSGSSLPWTSTVPVSKNGGATATSGTTVTGDTFSIPETSSASYTTAVSGSLTVGTTTGTYTVTTMNDPAAVGAVDITQLALLNPAGTGSTYTWSFTTTGGRVVVALYARNASGNIFSGATYGGVAMTKVTETTGGGGYNVSIWELAGVTAKTANIVATTNGGGFSTYAASGVARTLQNSSQAGVAVTSLAYGYHAAGTNKTGAATVPASGYGVEAVVSESNAATIGWVFGAKDGTDQSNASPLLGSVAHFSASGTPEVSGLDNLGSSIVAATWGP